MRLPLYKALSCVFLIAACPGMSNSNNVNIMCDTGTDTQGDPNLGFVCNAGYYFYDNIAPTKDECRPCAPIANSNGNGLTCSSGNPTRGDLLGGFQCNAGYYPRESLAGLGPDSCARMWP